MVDKVNTCVAVQKSFYDTLAIAGGALVFTGFVQWIGWEVNSCGRMEGIAVG